MKKGLTLILILFKLSGVYAQQIDYEKISNYFYKEISANTKAGLQPILKGQSLKDVLRKTTAEAHDTLNRYITSLANIHLSGTYKLKDLYSHLHKANVDLDAGLKLAARTVADTKQSGIKRLAAFQIMFGLSSLMHHPFNVDRLEPRDEFITYDIFLPWKNPVNYDQLYASYKLGVRLAQSEGNKQLTGYFKSKEDVNNISWIPTYLNRAFYVQPKGEITINEPVDGPEGDHKIYEPGETEPVYDLMAAHPSFPKGYNEFYDTINPHLVYPLEEWNRAIEGQAYVYFDVEKDGSTSHFKISGSITPNIDSAIIAAAHYLPKLIPGHLKDNPAPVRTFQVYSLTFAIKPGVKREDNFISPDVGFAINKPKPKRETLNHKFDLFQYIVRNSNYIGPPLGTVSIAYTVQISGEVTDVTVLKHLTAAADSEAVRLTKQATFWIPNEITSPRKKAIRDTLNIYLGNPPGKKKN